MENEGLELPERDHLKRKDSQKRKERLYKTDFFNKNKVVAVEGEDNRGLVVSPENSNTNLSALNNENIKDMESPGSPEPDNEWVNVPNLAVRHPKEELSVALNNYNNNVVNLRRLYFQQAMNQIEEMVNKVLVNIENMDDTWTFKHMSPSCFYEIKAHNEIDVFLVLKGISPSDIIVEEIFDPIGYARVQLITSSAPEEVEHIDDDHDIYAPVSLIHAMTSPNTSNMAYPMTSSMTSLRMTTESSQSATSPASSSSPVTSHTMSNRTSQTTSTMPSQATSQTTSTMPSQATSHMTSQATSDMTSQTTSTMPLTSSACSSQQCGYSKYCVRGEHDEMYLSAKRICRTFATLVNKASTDVLIMPKSTAFPFSDVDAILNSRNHKNELQLGNQNGGRSHDVEAGKTGKKLKKKVSFKNTSNVIPDVVEFPPIITPYIINLIPTIECPQLWPQCAAWLKTCTRKWPDNELKRKIVSEGVHLAAVPTGNGTDVWQIKFLNGSRCLIHHEGNESKATCLRLLKVICENDLSYPKAIVPFFLENILMWASRKYWSSSDWTDTNIPARFLELLAGLHKCIKNGDCHDFFLPSVNLFEALEAADLEILSNKVMDMLVDPFKYLE